MKLQRKAVKEPPVDIMCPLTGELASTDHPDDLADMVERLRNHLKDDVVPILYQAEIALANMADRGESGTTRTCRVQGKRRKVKIVFPPTHWDQSQLKEAFNSFPKIRDNYLKVTELRPIIKEVSKLLGTTVRDNPPLETFRKMVAHAACEPRGKPYVTIEE